ncbi:chemotaxis protein CheW [Gilvimarinus polysaccharolyticus]|uniref:chemotaxis protein CheW n=1 Tax=Gilvimarinus polysaccharolyticus TaxID=863921 RepID=UPI000673885E|nr:chemotaxis protein CheW [Gilvimarinus polysaccharolyticus]
MRAEHQIQSDSYQEIASLLVPLSDSLLLLPNVTVAEIVPVGNIQPVDNAPDWLLGEISWRERDIPIVAMEIMNGQARPSFTGRCRIAVLNTTGLDDSLGFIAILTQGLPRLARVTAAEIAERDDVVKASYDDLVVTWAGEQAVIPALAKIEQAYLEFSSQR